jgi:hypothetical protein
MASPCFFLDEFWEIRITFLSTKLTRFLYRGVLGKNSIYTQNVVYLIEAGRIWKQKRLPVYFLAEILATFPIVARNHHDLKM